ncbi:MBL fold metallo-hydrolase [Megasphaera hominis]|jgi:hydroxyacylglutathione hydrolase|uniref:MBL fold metallo-hydrolase n=3 Tax=Megasphaera TaxID=906 RepID=A0ABR6VJU3_9FIRM|nr:MBL fold metallo-hydrolase [Megasphaera hominis]MBC3537552.1 MBL fold metallo-hydrolase [Megasphaera hominis]
MIQTLLVKGYFSTYCYLFIDEKTKHGFLIDAPSEADKLAELVREKGYTIEKILLTHGHFDHTAAANELSRTWQAPVLIHAAGKRYVKDTVWNLSAACGLHVVVDPVTYLRGDETITLAANPAVALQVLPTPGHTPDSVTYYSAADHAAFVGDTIFAGSFGSSGYYGGDLPALMHSIFERILVLPDDTVLYSGHSEPTTVYAEKSRISQAFPRK